jgi:hypothetical protein
MENYSLDRPFGWINRKLLTIWVVVGMLAVAIEQFMYIQNDQKMRMDNG